MPPKRDGCAPRSSRLRRRKPLVALTFRLIKPLTDPLTESALRACAARFRLLVRNVVRLGALGVLGAESLGGCGGGIMPSATANETSILAIDGMPSTGSRPPPVIHRPPNLRLSAPAPLVIALHASGGRPAGFEATSGLDAVADRHGFVVAYLGSPEPTSPAWRLADMTSNLAYISSEIRSLTASENIDPKRVYVTGFSAGATMAFFVACQLSSQIDGFAPVSSTMRIQIDVTRHTRYRYLRFSVCATPSRSMAVRCCCRVSRWQRAGVR